MALNDDLGRALGLEKPWAPDAFTRVHDGVVRADGGVAWVEERRVGEDDGGFVDASIVLKVAAGGGLLLTAELPTYNPYFGCRVYGMAWTADDRVVLAYHEKHAALVSVWTMTGEVALVRCELHELVALSGELVVYRDDDPTLLQVLTVPGLESATPVPVAPLEEPFSLVEPRVLARGGARVALPSVSQVGRVRDALAFQASVVERLSRDVKVSRPLLEVLVGSACAPFWAPAPEKGAGYAAASRRSFESSLRWFPAWRHAWLEQNGRTAEAGALLVAFDALEPRSALEGWSPGWSFADGVVELGAQHVRATAQRLREACLTGRLPDGTWDGLWSYPRVTLEQYPASLQHAFSEVAASPPKAFDAR